MELIDEAAKYLNKDIIMPTGWRLTWCYPNGKHQDDYYADVPDFKGMNQTPNGNRWSIYHFFFSFSMTIIL
ncbi:MAG: hypothetical protein HFG34_04865 [Eubacterium sp.]|nr:hypothetical protein [Eubacterium sp.]